jgi:hypothetical protein
MNMKLFGQFLLEEGVIDADQLYEALRYQRENNKVLGELARDEGILTEVQVTEVLDWQLCQDQDFGQAALEMGMLDLEQLGKLLLLQRERRVYLGDALVALGIIDRQRMKSELKRCADERDQPERLMDKPEQGSGEDAPMTLWSIFSRVLPRFTGGAVLSGGFYPTILQPLTGRRFSQRIAGEMEFELVILISNELNEVISKAGKGKTSAAMLTSILEVFCSRMEATGVAVAPAGKAKSIGPKALAERRDRASRTSCVEFVLIQPPLPDGEFHQINCCLILGKGC